MSSKARENCNRSKCWYVEREQRYVSIKACGSRSDRRRLRVAESAQVLPSTA